MKTKLKLCLHLVPTRNLLVFVSDRALGWLLLLFGARGNWDYKAQNRWCPSHPSCKTSTHYRYLFFAFPRTWGWDSSVGLTPACKVRYFSWLYFEFILILLLRAVGVNGNWGRRFSECEIFDIWHRLWWFISIFIIITSSSLNSLSTQGFTSNMHAYNPKYYFVGTINESSCHSTFVLRRLFQERSTHRRCRVRTQSCSWVRNFQVSSRKLWCQGEWSWGRFLSRRREAL